MSPSSNIDLVLESMLDTDVRFRSIGGRDDIGAGDSIQDRLDGRGAGAHIRITDEYDPSVESLPVRVEHPGIEIQGTAGGAGNEATIRNATGNDLFHLNQNNRRNPGVVLRDLKIVQTAGGSAINCTNSKFNYFENVHADANRVGSDDLWHFGTAADTYGNNTQILVGCSAEEAGRDGFQFGALAHHIAMFGCTALNCSRMGVYVNGPYSFKFIGGQLEDCGEPGLRARVADVVLLGGNTYLEGNARRGRFENADVAFLQTPNATVEQAWMNAKPDGTSHAVLFRDSPSGAVRNIQTDHGFDSLVWTNSADTELNRASHRTPPRVKMVQIGNVAQRVRDQGVIVGAGQSNGGNNDINGVDLAEVSGSFPLDVAVSDGTNAAWGVPARWDGTAQEWVPSDGSARVGLN